MRIVGISWVAFGIVKFFIYLYHQDWSWDWNTAGSFATWILAGGIFFIFWQIIEARRSTNAEVAVELFKKLRDKDVLDTLREIYALKPNDIRRLLTSTEEKDVKLAHSIEGVLDKFELLGALVARGIIDERIAIEAYGGPPALKCWYQLGENYIKKVRKQRGLFCKYVEDFAARTWEYQNVKQRRHKEEWIKFRRGEKGKQINLVEYFENRLALRPKRYK